MIFWFFVWLYGWFVPVPVYIPPPPPPVVQQVIVYPPCPRYVSPGVTACS